MIRMNWSEVFYQPVTRVPLGVQLGDRRIDETETLRFRMPKITLVSVQSLRDAIEPFVRASAGHAPQLAFYVFSATRRSEALNTYFPLLGTLDETGQKSFYKLAKEIMINPGFDVGILGEKLANLAPHQPQIAYFLAAHIAEIFFYRRDLLERLLTAKCRIRLYKSQEAFEKDGGAAGGSFSPVKGVQLVLARLFEGFNAPTPGVAPFLHEFGHLLDVLDVGHGVIDKSSGFLPGMRESDGALYSAEARDLFLKGKRLELERYNRLYNGDSPADPLPIGHPYVFQNDTEFIAGYFEMFFRNPHYFAKQNPDLFQSFVLTFGQDPRQAWAEDFPFYIQQNRDFYLSGKRPAQAGLTIPQ
jgi:Glucose-regulated metallo-peptidase M90